MSRVDADAAKVPEGAPAGKFSARGRCGECVEDLVLVEVRCAGCFAVVYFCSRDYHGQIYGDDGCRKRAKRRANVEHQQTKEGRRDHADHNAAYRARRRVASVPATIVTDTRSHSLPTDALSCSRDAALASAMEDHVVVAQGTHHGTTDSDDEVSSTRDADASEGGARHEKTGATSTCERKPPSCSDDAFGGQNAGSIRCLVCGRPGQFFRDPAAGPARVGRKRRSLQGRRRRPRPPHGAAHSRFRSL